jgi:hypothetical protein
MISLIISFVIIIFVLVIFVAAISKGYSYKHTVDRLEDNPHVKENKSEKKE